MRAVPFAWLLPAGALLLVVSPASAAPRPSIAALQVGLRDRGLYHGQIDGLLGAKTVASVRAFERLRGLRVDGVPGPRTRAELGRYADHELGSRFLSRGKSGWDVAELQFVLSSLHLLRTRPSGRFGAPTQRAVRRYQRSVGLAVDGVAGPAMFAFLGLRTPPIGGEVGLARDAYSVTTTSIPSSFARPLFFALGSHRWHAAPSDLGARSRRRPFRATAATLIGSRGKPAVVVDRRAIRAYVASLAGIFDRAALDARLFGFERYHPVIAEARSGRKIVQPALVRLVVRRLLNGKRDLIRVPVRRIEAHRTRANFGAIVFVQRSRHRLYLFSGATLIRVFRIGTGRPRDPTPVGRFVITFKARDPWWKPPHARWAAKLAPIPPGPGNPLGTRWLGLSVPEVGIHGTPDRASLGYSRSHGCIRMGIHDAEWLYERVRVGTPVIVVRG
jgi:peptidoglycan hydrolase-like protein with peptidoglycan-binding domain